MQNKNISLKEEDEVRITGKVKITVRDAKTGKILQIIESKNLIVNAGRNLVATLLNGESIALPNYCAVGSGTTTPSVNDTVLEGEIGRLPVTARSRSNNIITYSTFFGAGDCNGTWNKVGLFNAQSGGTLFSELLISPSITKDTTKTVDIEYTITVGG
jgi:hypothetical protein